MDIFCMYDAYCSNFFHLPFCALPNKQSSLIQQNNKIVLLPILSHLIHMSLFDTIFLMRWLGIPVYQSMMNNIKTYFVQIEHLESVFFDGSFSATVDHMFYIRYRQFMVQDPEFSALLGLIKLSTFPVLHQ